jgi:serine/threonine protein kinase
MAPTQYPGGLDQTESTLFRRSEHILHTSTSVNAPGEPRAQDAARELSNPQRPDKERTDIDVYPLLEMILHVYERDRLYNNSLFLGKVITTAYWRWPIVGKGASFLVRKSPVLSDRRFAQGGRFVSSRRAVTRSDTEGKFWTPPVVTKQLVIPNKGSQKGNGQKLLDSVALELCVLTHHPLFMHENIVDFYGLQWDMDEDSRIWPVLVVEEAELGTLASLQKSSTALEFSTKLELSLDIALALDALHGCGIVHSDVSLCQKLSQLHLR